MTEEGLTSTKPTKEELISVTQIMYKHKEKAILSMNSLYIPGSAQATEHERQIVQLRQWYKETRERIEAMFTHDTHAGQYGETPPQESIETVSTEDTNVSGT